MFDSALQSKAFQLFDRLAQGSLSANWPKLSYTTKDRLFAQFGECVDRETIEPGFAEEWVQSWDGPVLYTGRDHGGESEVWTTSINDRTYDDRDDAYDAVLSDLVDDYGHELVLTALINPSFRPLED